MKKYAVSEKSSLGREYLENKSPLRNDFQRDRDRIIHSSAFRRLMYKTQVFVNHEGDMFRTRLTHSLEVSQISRGIARSLELNEDLSETIALAHDLGHTPFGHAGQDALNQCMKDHGGFEHNFQSLRVVDKLEKRYSNFSGLNLTFESREGILKHCSKKNAIHLGTIGERFLNKTHPSLEAQIVDIADSIAYNIHDLEDGYRSGILPISKLNQLDFFARHYNYLKKDFDFLVVDFHGEITSEKNAIGHYFDGKASLVVGTHTHIPTNDARILKGGTGYQTDAGMCGDYNSVIGMNAENSLNRFLKKNSVKHFPAIGDATLCGVIVECNINTGLATNIESYIFGAQLKNTH